MMMQWARAHFGAGSNVVLGFQPPAGAAGTLAASRPRVVQAAQPQPGWLDRLDAWLWRQEQKRREAFLAQASDVFDLERRIRHLDRASGAIS